MATDRRPTSRRGAIRTALDALGHRPQKRLGQHFLSDVLIAERIVALADIRPGEAVVEVGPGLGVLTEHLAPRADQLLLVELDPILAAGLTERYGDTRSVRVLHADALTIDYPELLTGLPPAVAIGNLPYNIATPLLARILEARAHFRRGVFMLQLEVAERLVASPGTRAYGSLSVLTQLWCDTRIAFRVPAGAFVPRPQVDSAVVVFDLLRAPRVAVGDLARFRHVVRGVFQHRRKQLGNAARGIIADPLVALRAAGIDPTRRPETLSLEEFARLADQVA